MRIDRLTHRVLIVGLIIVFGCNRSDGVKSASNNETGSVDSSDFDAEPAHNDVEEKTNRTLSLKLETTQHTIFAGTELVLRLTIENVGNADEQILKPRGDLQDTYYDLVITTEGKPLELTRAISDPGEVSEEDFLNLKPGNTVTFEFSRYAVLVDSLPPGKYQAQICFWQDPLKSHRTAMMSPATTFQVEK